MLNKLKNATILLFMAAFLFACIKQKENFQKEEIEIEELEIDWSCFLHLEKDKLYVIRSYEELDEHLGEDTLTEEDLGICLHCFSLLMVRGQSGVVTKVSYTLIKENQYQFNIIVKQTPATATSDWGVAVSIPRLDEEDKVRLNIDYKK